MILDITPIKNILDARLKYSAIIDKRKNLAYLSFTVQIKFI
ncbi:hypothetical protein HMPREF9444_01075 [Succinatimonas hippei YIT 12066]|uniref:Uncharacterized protein n=1 Tax=Succinatimonas hippei (strain DSM 22608 / JCM 16073 / KCTC 15190 / YIT 12066) TaxID=762983 RepID=E8LK39_SUCHY|nr:hypothetical protein HMPREF9444_01075 [Succinatimonas hippei YIT 12066]